MRSFYLKRMLGVIILTCFFMNCKKFSKEKIQEFSLEKEWIHNNGGAYNQESLILKLLDGTSKTGSLNWSEVIKFKVKDIDYTEIPFTFNGEESIRKTNGLNGDNISFSFMMRTVDNKIEAAIKVSQNNSILKQGIGEIIGNTEQYSNLDGSIINTWFHNVKDGQLKSLHKGTTVNAVSTNSKVKLAYIQPTCEDVAFNTYEYQCTVVGDASTNYDTECGWQLISSQHYLLCDPDTGGGGSTWPPGGNTPNNPPPTTPPSTDCATFDNKVLDILDAEGGFTNDPNDPGGATNKGISWNVWEANAQSVLGVEPTLQNLQNITTNQAKEIYRNLYWNPIHADDIIDGDMRYMLFDFFVNAGGNAVKVLQKTINQLGGSVTIDGVIGLHTLNAINSMNKIDLYNIFKNNRQLYYNNLVAKNSKLATFLNGWTNRVNKFVNKTSQKSDNVNC